MSPFVGLEPALQVNSRLLFNLNLKLTQEFIEMAGVFRRERRCSRVRVVAMIIVVIRDRRFISIQLQFITHSKGNCRINARSVVFKVNTTGLERFLSLVYCALF